MLTQDIRHRFALLGFLQDAEDLFFRVSLLHGFWMG